MKALNLLSIVGVLALAGCAAPQNDILTVLKTAADEGTPLYGHQDDLMYGHTWNATKENDYSFKRSDVLATAGDYPAVLGLELGGIELGNKLNIDGNDFDIIRAGAQKHYKRGGIVTISWHPRNPLTGGDTWDVSSDKAVASILPGGEKHEMFMGWLASCADFIESIGIPFIFRPWHEHTGDWFWWCDGMCTPEEYNALWIMTYKYFTEERGIKGIVWAISPNIMEHSREVFEPRYPGDEYVDIVGLDLYEFKSADETVEAASERYVQQMRVGIAEISGFAVEHGKVFAMCEAGYEGLHDPNWWTGALAPSLEGFPVSYVLTWRNSSSEIPPFDKDHHFYAPWPGQQSEADFKAWCNSGKVKLLKNI